MLPGYIASAGITVELRRDATVPFTVIEKAISDGRIVLWISSAAPFWPTESRFDLGSQAAWRLPSLRRSLWEFDAHRGVQNRDFYVFACPLWLPLIVAIAAAMRVGSGVLVAFKAAPDLNVPSFNRETTPPNG